MAIAFHEVWKPAAYDKSLHERMGVSLATNAFHVVQAALRREMLLALMRLWDRRAISWHWRLHWRPAHPAGEAFPRRPPHQQACHRRELERRRRKE